MTDIPKEAIEAALAEHARVITEIFDKGKGLIPADREVAMTAALKAAAPLMGDYVAALNYALAFDQGRADGIEAAAVAALEQRCERNTPWDTACVAIAAAIRALKRETKL